MKKLAIMTVAITWVHLVSAGEISHRVVVRPGDAVPGVPSRTFQDVQGVAISPSGKIAFRGSTEGFDSGIWVDESGVVSLVAWENTPSSVDGFDWGRSVGFPNLKAAGRVAIRWGLADPDTESEGSNGGIFVETSEGSLRPVAVNGEPTPIAGTTFQIPPPTSLRDETVLLDDFNRVALTTTLAGAVDEFSDDSLWFHDGTALRLVAREGDPAPGGSKFWPVISSFTGQPVRPSIDLVALGGNGHLLFRARLEDRRSGLYLYSEGNLERIAVTGEGFSGLGANETISSLNLFSVNRPGQVAFGARVSDTETGDRFDVHLISNAARTGFAVVNRLPLEATPNEERFELGGRSLNDLGQLIDQGFFTDTNGVRTRAILRVDSSGSVQVLTKEGDLAPGTDGERFKTISAVQVNAVGQFTFSALLDNDNFGSNFGIWAGSGPSDIELVVLNGDAIDGIPSVSIIEPMSDSPAGSGLSSYLSDQGEILWTTTTVSGSSGARAAVVSFFGDPPPPPPRLVGLEAVQVVQDWQGSVPLYADKPTLIRAHIQSDVVTNSEIILRVFDNGNFEMPFSPLSVEAPAGLFTSGPEGGTKRLRRRLAGSANFTLPPIALSDTISVKVENLTGSLDCREVAGVNPNDCSLELSFQTPQVPELRILALNWFDPAIAQVRVLDRAARQNLVDRLISLYPAASVDWDDRELLWPGFPDLDQVLPFTRRLRALDKCSEATGCRRMYYAAIPLHSLEGVAYLDGYAGTGYVHPNPRAEGRHTHSHEIGHNLARHHSAADSLGLTGDGDKQGPCGSIAGADKPEFPFLTNFTGLKARPGRHPKLRQALGPMLDGDDSLVYGYDSMQERVVSPFRYFDLMGYCSSPVIDMWPSVHSYGELATKIQQRYTVIKRFLPKGRAQDYVLVSGAIDPASGAVTLLAVDHISNSQLPDGSPAGAWEARLLDAGGSPLSTTAFEPEVIDPRGTGAALVSFTVPLADPGSGTAIEIRDDQGATVATRSASPTAPTVTLLSPNGGETLAADEATIEWISDDSDGDAVSHAIQFSGDGGTSWTTLHADVAGLSVTVPRNILPATSQGLFRVIASDGFNQAQDDSDGVFSVANSAPSVSILAPEDGRLVLTGESLTLRASAYDTEDGVLGDAALEWSSDVDGSLGTGLMLPVAATSLTPGEHQLAATATDGMAATGTDSVTLTVSDLRPAVLVDVGVLLTDLADPKRAEEPHDLTLLVENAGPDTVDDLVVDVTLQVSPMGPAKGGPGQISEISAPAGWGCTAVGLTATCDAPALEALSETEIVLAVLISQESGVTGTASFTTSATDALGGNNTSVVDYRVGQSDRIFSNGFE